MDGDKKDNSLMKVRKEPKKGTEFTVRTSFSSAWADLHDVDSFVRFETVERFCSCK